VNEFPFDRTEGAEVMLAFFQLLLEELFQFRVVLSSDERCIE
jgi:hypothetical protein